MKKAFHEQVLVQFLYGSRAMYLLRNKDEATYVRRKITEHREQIGSDTIKEFVYEVVDPMLRLSGVTSLGLDVEGGEGDDFQYEYDVRRNQNG